MVESRPLLKFPDEKADLRPEGLALIKGLKGKICPVILIGDGRGGKSYLASRILNVESAFESSDSAEPVTEGIDIVARSMRDLLGPSGAEDEHLLVMDCEGGNNAMAAIRTLVNVFGIVVGTEVLFVAAGMASEQALQNLAASLAARSLIRLGDEKLPEQSLIFVVNKNALKYGDDAFEKILGQSQDNPQRKELRDSIKEAFPERMFCIVPMMGLPDFEPKVEAMRKEILDRRKPLTLGGVMVDGPRLCGLLEVVVTEVRKTNEVSFPSAMRYVIFDGFLLPVIDKLFTEYEQSLPRLTDYDKNASKKDNRAGFMDNFDEQVSHIRHQGLVSEARKNIEERLQNAWGEVMRTNEAFGGEVRLMETENRETPVDTSVGEIGGRGLLSKVKVTMKTMKIESRPLIHRKRGGEPERGEWTDTGSTTMRIVESAFEKLTTLPVIRGRLFKKSPNLIRMVVTLGQAVAQDRACILKDGHFIWWTREAMDKRGEAKGCVNLLINRAQIVPEGATAFIIKPANDQGWADVSGFSGGDSRQFIFDTEGTDISRSEWVKAFAQHIEFGNLAAQQIGKEKLYREAGVYKPTLTQVDA